MEGEILLPLLKVIWEENPHIPCGCALKSKIKTTRSGSLNLHPVQVGACSWGVAVEKCGMVRPRVGHCPILLQYAFSMLGIIFFPISSSFSPFPFFPFLLLSHSFPLFFLPLLFHPPSPSFLYMSSERFNAQPHTHTAPTAPFWQWSLSHSSFPWAESSTNYYISELDLFGPTKI